MQFLISCVYAALLFISVHAEAQDLSSGLIAWYKFDGDTKDASTYANHGNPHNVTFGSGKCGQANSAVYLNGRDAYINLPLASSLNGKKQLTITAWIKPVRFNNITQTLKSVYAHWIDTGIMDPVGVLFGVGADSSVVSAFTGGYQVSSSTVVRSDNWQLVTLLYDGTKATEADRAIFQVNCKEYKPDCSNGYSTCSATPPAIGSLATYTYIGVRQDNAGQLIDYFEGYIDDIRLYDRVLTKDELNQLFLECGSPPCDDNNCLTEDQINPKTCQCEHIVKVKPTCDDNNCLTEDRLNENTCQCEHVSKTQPDCNDSNSQTEDTYNTTTCACEHHLTPNSPKLGIYTPSAFTPDGDGINDIYKPVYQGVTTATLTVFDRWGEIIYHSSNLTDGWDGTYKGVPCMQGVYSYRMTGIYDTGEEFTFQGNISLIK